MAQQQHMEDDTSVACDRGRQRRVFTMEEVGFFEGTEKLLEMWFSLPDDRTDSRGLRDMPR